MHHTIHKRNNLKIWFCPEIDPRSIFSKWSTFLVTTFAAKSPSAETSLIKAVLGFGPFPFMYFPSSWIPFRANPSLLAGAVNSFEVASQMGQRPNPPYHTSIKYAVWNTCTLYISFLRLCAKQPFALLPWEAFFDQWPHKMFRAHPSTTIHPLFLTS